MVIRDKPSGVYAVSQISLSFTTLKAFLPFYGKWRTILLSRLQVSLLRYKICELDVNILVELLGEI